MELSEGKNTPIENVSEIQELQIQLSALTRRFNRMESNIFGLNPLRNKLRELLSLYTDARESRITSETSARLWAAIVNNLDEVSLFLLARHTRDPFPWRPFLALLDAHTSKGHGAYTERATLHLLEVAESMLKLQGLGALRPCDVLHSSATIQPS